MFSTYSSWMSLLYRLKKTNCSINSFKLTIGLHKIQWFQRKDTLFWGSEVYLKWHEKFRLISDSRGGRLRHRSLLFSFKCYVNLLGFSWNMPLSWWLKKRHLFSHSSGSHKSDIKFSAPLISFETSLSCTNCCPLLFYVCISL